MIFVTAFTNRLQDLYSGDVGRLHLSLLMSGVIPLMIYAILDMNSRKQDREALLELSKGAAEAEQIRKKHDLEMKIKAEQDNLMIDFTRCEKTYRDGLQLFEETYLKPIVDKKLMTNSEFEEQFNYLQTIMKLHTQFRHSMKKMAKHNGATTAIWNSLPDFFAQVKDLYIPFSACYKKCLCIRGNILVRNQKLLSFLDLTDVKAGSSPNDKCKTFDQMLVTPFAHIRDLEILLQKIVQFISRANDVVPACFGHHDISNMQSCHAILKELQEEIVVHCHGWEERAFNHANLIQVMASFAQSSRVNLLDDPSRALVQEGFLVKRCRKEDKTFYFWLFSDKIMYGVPTTYMGIGRQEYQVNREINLMTIRIGTKFDASIDNRERAIMIECPEKSFVVWAPTISEAFTWKENFQKCAAEIRIHLSEEVNIVAPVWIPDHEVSNCTRCKARFNWIKRKHHCRNCGDVVCNPCSKQHFNLKHLGSGKPVRTCDKCFASLSNPASADNSPNHKGGSISTLLASP